MGLLTCAYSLVVLLRGWLSEGSVCKLKISGGFCLPSLYGCFRVLWVAQYTCINSSEN